MTCRSTADAQRTYIGSKDRKKERNMASVSLCMIVKDEEAVLARCLKSVQGFADEIVIVDTGSADRTKEIAAGFTEQIYSIPWEDDFAAARNFAFSKGTGDYLFWLDADDVILEEELHKLKGLKERLDQEQPDVVMMKYAVGFDQSGRPTFTFYRERLIRNCGQARFRGCIHEAVVPFGRIIREDITIEHHKIKQSDTGRNLRIFEKMKEEGQKFNAREQYYYGKELYYHRQYHEALEALESFLEMPEAWREDKTDACRHAALCRYQLSEYEKAGEALFRALAFGIPRPELCCDIGGWFLDRQEWKEAAYWYRQALRNARTAGKDGFIQQDYWGYIPCLQLCVCYDRMRNYHLAERYNTLAERLKPGTEACGKNRRYFERRRAEMGQNRMSDI